MKVAQQNVSLSKDFCAHINVSIKLDTTTMALQYHNRGKNSLIKLVSGNLSFMAENTFFIKLDYSLYHIICMESLGEIWISFGHVFPRRQR